MAKTMTYEDLIRIAVETGTDGIDMTVYWLPATTDDVLLPLRRFAWKNRVEIYSIGARVPAGAAHRGAPREGARRAAEVGRRGAENGRVAPAGFRRQQAGRRHHGPGDRLCRRDHEARRRVRGRPRRHRRPGRRRRDYGLREGDHRDRQADGFSLGGHEPRYREFPAAEGLRPDRDVDSVRRQHPREDHGRERRRQDPFSVRLRPRLHHVRAAGLQGVHGSRGPRPRRIRRSPCRAICGS